MRDPISWRRQVHVNLEITFLIDSVEVSGFNVCNLLTGFAGLQHGVILAAEPHALPLKFRLLPEYLNSGFNFSSHIVGKWHLGSYRDRYVPTSRGFESHYGYWTGKEDYYQHTNLESEKVFLSVRVRLCVTDVNV